MKIQVITLIAVLLVSLPVISGLDIQKGRSRIDALFKWKVSDTLQLDLQGEEKLGKIIKEIGDQKVKVNDELALVSEKLEKEKSKEARRKILGEYRALLKQTYEIQLKELDEFEQVFGVDNLAKYIELKFDLKNKFSKYLSAGHYQSVDTKLADPKIIEED